MGEKFLLVDLNEKKTKSIAKTIMSDTSRKVLNHLIEKEDSLTNISKAIGVSDSTTYYHLQKLQEAGLVVVEEFHYSKKGREVNHYKLANKYIIIAPKKSVDLKKKLRKILPVGLAVSVLGFFGWLGLLAMGQIGISQIASSSRPGLTGLETSSKQLVDQKVAETVVSEVVATEPSVWLWFAGGVVSALALGFAIYWIRKRFCR